MKNHKKKKGGEAEGKLKNSRPCQVGDAYSTNEGGLRSRERGGRAIGGHY